MATQEFSFRYCMKPARNNAEAFKIVVAENKVEAFIAFYDTTLRTRGVKLDTTHESFKRIKFTKEDIDLIKSRGIKTEMGAIVIYDISEYTVKPSGWVM